MFENCLVRPMSFEDLATVLDWRNHIEVRRFMLTQHEIGLEEHRNWFSNATKDSSRRLMIVQENQIPLGFVQLKNLGQNSVADWGFYTRPDAPKGNGRKLGWAALDYAFNNLGLHKVCGQAIESNQASINFHKRLGFQQEGALREQQQINGDYHTLICFGLINREWRPELLFQENTYVQN